MKDICIKYFQNNSRHVTAKILKVERERCSNISHLENRLLRIIKSQKDRVETEREGGRRGGGREREKRREDSATL